MERSGAGQGAAAPHRGGARTSAIVRARPGPPLRREDCPKPAQALQRSARASSAAGAESALVARDPLGPGAGACGDAATRAGGSGSSSVSGYVFRLIANGENACCTDISSIVFTFT